MALDPARQLAIHLVNGEVQALYADGLGIEVLVITEGVPANPDYLQAHAVGEDDLHLIDKMPENLLKACMFNR